MVRRACVRIYLVWYGPTEGFKDWKNLKRLDHIEGEDGQACAFFYVIIYGLVLVKVKVPKSTSKYTEVPRSISKYPEVPQSTQKYIKVPRSTAKYPEVPQSIQKYLKVPRST